MMWPLGAAGPRMGGRCRADRPGPATWMLLWLGLVPVAAPAISGEPYSTEYEVRLDAVVDRRGEVGAVRVLGEPPEALAEMAVERLRRTTFAPDRRRTEPSVAVVRFRLEETPAGDWQVSVLDVSLEEPEAQTALTETVVVELQLDAAGKVVTARLTGEPQEVLGALALKEVRRRSFDALPPGDAASVRRTYATLTYLLAESAAGNWEVSLQNVSCCGPFPVKRVPPEYPRGAVLAGTQGWVRVGFVIEPDGAVEDARILEAEPQGVFDKAALAAIRQWRFEPETLDGEAAPRQFQQVIEFRIGN